MTEAERIEKDAKAEDLLVEMSVTLNNLCRHYDQKDEQGMKFTMQKAYELSHKGIGHLMELDKLTAENSRLQQQLKEKDEAIKLFVPQMEYANNTIKKFIDAYNEKERQLKSACSLHLFAIWSFG